MTWRPKIKSWDLVIVLAATIGIYLFSCVFDISEKLIELFTQLESWEIDEAIPALVFFSLSLVWLLKRRNASLQEEIHACMMVEDALQGSEERFWELVESSGDMIWEVTAGGVYSYVSPQVEALLGYKPDEVLGKTPFDLMPPEETERVLSTFKDVTTKGEPIILLENVNLHKDGRRIVLETSGVPVFDASGEVTGYRGVDRDITERKAVQEELLKIKEDLEILVKERTTELEMAYEELMHKNKELNEFIYIASHDLQEPLRKIASFSALLKQDLGDNLPGQVKMDIDFITDATMRMDMLIKNLLDLSRAGSMQLHHEQICLLDCAIAAVETLSVKIRKTGAKIIYSDLPDVWGDRTMLTQLYQNLIGNALKFIADVPPEIHLTYESIDGETVLGVKDNGIGIKREYCEKIFAPFKRLHGRTSYEGTGIGLSVCRKAVESHGGRIWVESEPGEGAYFKFTLDERSKDEAEDTGCHAL